LRVKPRTALALCKAGYRNPDHVAGLTREELLRIWAVGEDTLRKIEAALGRPLSSPALIWRKRGIGGLAARMLVEAGIETLDQLAAVTREELLRLDGMGGRLVAQIENGLGIRLKTTKTKLPCWMQKGLTRRTAAILRRAHIMTVEQLRSLGYEDLSRLGIHFREILRIARLTRNAPGGNRQSEEGPE
jgi:nucleotidyltransferase/DNA polymerase involved in DNA repair